MFDPCAWCTCIPWKTAILTHFPVSEKIFYFELLPVTSDSGTLVLSQCCTVPSCSLTCISGNSGATDNRALLPPSLSLAHPDYTSAWYAVPMRRDHRYRLDRDLLPSPPCSPPEPQHHIVVCCGTVPTAFLTSLSSSSPPPAESFSATYCALLAIPTALTSLLLGISSCPSWHFVLKI